MIFMMCFRLKGMPYEEKTKYFMIFMMCFRLKGMPYEEKTRYFIISLMCYRLKVHKHEKFVLTFFAETETIWSQGPVTRDF